MNHKIKILLFIDWYLPGFRAGGPIRSCANLVDHLSEQFEFYIITRDTDYCEEKPYSGVESGKWNSTENGAKVYYFSKENLSYSSLREVVKSVEFDVAYVNGMYSKFFSIYPLIILKGCMKRILVAPRGMLAESAIGVKSIKKSIFLLMSKWIGLYNNVIFHATNDKEKTDIISRFKGASVMVAPNLHRLSFSKPNSIISKQEGELKLISIARISPEKNLKFILGSLLELKGEIQLDVYGSVYDQEYWDACLKIIAQLPSNIKVNYKDVIDSNNIPGKLEEYHFLVLPSLGENFGHVILESFMSSRPVIISDQTPWYGLEEKRIGWDVSLEDVGNYTSAMKSAVELANDEFQEMCSEAKKFADSITTDPNIIKQSVALFKS